MFNILREVWRKDRLRFSGVLFLHIAVALMSSVSIVMLVPLLEMVDISVEGSSWGWLLAPYAALPEQYRVLFLILIFVLIIVVRSFIQKVSAVKQNIFLTEYELDLRHDLYDAVFCADYESLSQIKSSELINLIVAQCRQCKLCLQSLMTLFSSFATALMHLAIACFISLPITLVVLAIGSVFLFLFKPFREKSRDFGQKSIEANREIYKEIQNQFGGIKEIRAYGVEDEHRELFEKSTRDAADIAIELTRLRVVPQFFSSIAMVVLVAIAFIISVLILDVGSGQLILLVYIFSRLWPMFSSWQGQLQTIQSYVPAWDKVGETVKNLKSGEREPIPCDGELSFTREIRFDNVSFSYRDSDTYVLKDASFVLPFGTITALAGLSGAGKSTTADLLMGLLKPTGGQILADDIPLSDENILAWRKSVGYIPQDPFVLNGTLRENLLRFRPGATDEEMIAALKKSQAWKFVGKWEKGLDTVIGEKGLGLSGGERQRVVLARVMMGNPSLIILDEATSALDFESEIAIRDTLQELKGGATILVIAHRLSTIKGADRAIVLEDGRVGQCDDIEALLQSEDGYLKRMLLSE